MRFIPDIDLKYKKLIYSLAKSGGDDPAYSEFSFTITAGALTQTIYLTQSSANAVTVDWGDGSEPDNPSDLTASLSHTYDAAGDYIVKITVAEGETWTPGYTSGSDSYGFLGLFSSGASYSTLTSAVLGRGAGLGNYAFAGCTGLTSITIPNSVTSIGNLAFNGCTGLTSITIPNSVTSIGNSTFGGCTSLRSAVLSNAVTSLGGAIFVNCTSLDSVIIPHGMTTIGSTMFASCRALSSVTIPSSVTSILTLAFFGCTALTSITSLNLSPPDLVPNAFQNIVNYIIYVPASALNDYKSASNWSDISDHIQAIV